MSLAAFRAVGRLRGVGHGSRLVLYALADHHNGKNGFCCPGQRAIADHAGIQRRSVQRCIDDLVGSGLIEIIPGGGIGKGGRKTDAYRFLFRLPDSESDAIGDSDARNGDSVAPIGDLQCPEPGIEPGIKSEDSRADARKATDSIPDLTLAVKMIWQSFSQSGRNRSSLLDTEQALARALRRRPDGVSPDARLEEIMRGLRAYLDSDDAKKDQGAFQKGVHRMIEKDRWSSFIVESTEEEAAGLEAHGLGTMEAPTEKGQRMWADMARKGLPWNSARGPRPGLPGCRISDAIQREFGFEPYAPPPPGDLAPADPVDDDYGAFA